MVSKAVKNQLKMSFQQIQINLENNYKDLAIQARKDTAILLQQLYDSGEVKGRTYEKYKAKLDEYTKRMENYHH